MTTTQLQIYQDAINDVLTSRYFTRARNAAAGKLVGKEISQMEDWEKDMALLLVRIGKIVNEDTDHNKSPVRRPAPLALNS